LSKYGSGSGHGYYLSIGLPCTCGERVPGQFCGIASAGDNLGTDYLLLTQWWLASEVETIGGPPAQFAVRLGIRYIHFLGGNCFGGTRCGWTVISMDVFACQHLLGTTFVLGYFSQLLPNIWSRE
jgi:hypothetical protein